jgi:hypothetical protein
MQGRWPPVWVNPMLGELAASLVVNRSALGRPSTLTTASLEAQASLADTRSPPRMV